jgi:hypothetical protein
MSWGDVPKRFALRFKDPELNNFYRGGRAAGEDEKEGEKP